MELVFIWLAAAGTDYLDTTLGDRPPSCTFTPRFISWLTVRPMWVLVPATGVWENGIFSTSDKL